jgi:hypothetical protein
MNSKTGSEHLPWLICGIALLSAFLAFAWYAGQGSTTAEQLASRANRTDLVERMQADLASASEAERSAVLAVTDADSETFASQARGATAKVTQEHEELGALLATGGSSRERDLLAQFSSAFTNLRRVNDEVLALAVKNTNIKAYGLLFGPAAETLAEMDAALDRVAAKRAGSTSGTRVMEMALRARIGVLRIQTLLAPHIAEENDTKMDQLEASMTAEETLIRKELDGLATLTTPTGDADVAAASSRFAQYEEIKAQILPLSRENSNVRSVSLSLNQTRKAMIVCLDSLNALKDAIVDEPIPGVTYGRPARPR